MTAPGGGPQKSLEFSFIWSVPEHARAQHAITLTRLRTEGLMVMIFAALGLLLLLNGVGVFFALQGNSTVVAISLPVTAVLFGLTWLLLFGRGWIDAWNQRRNDNTLQHPIHHYLSENGLRVRGRSAEVALRWKAMKLVAETDDFLLFYYSTGSAYYLPKRVVAKDRIEELRGLIKTHAGAAARDIR